MNWWLFLIPASGALSCWLTARSFFVVLFHPQRPRPIIGFRLQGVLPSKQSEIAAQTGKIVAEQFFSMQMIEEKITDPAILQKIMPAIETHIDYFLRHKLKEQMPFIGMFIGDKTINSLKEIFITELEALFPTVMKSYAANLASDLNIEGLVSEKIASISLADVERTFYRRFSKQIMQVQLMSASIGLLIGFMTMLIIFWIK